jgi:hypothetical protein
LMTMMSLNVLKGLFVPLKKMGVVENVIMRCCVHLP